MCPFNYTWVSLSITRTNCCLEWQLERKVNTRTYCAEEEVSRRREHSKFFFFFLWLSRRIKEMLFQSYTPQSRWHFMCSCWAKMTLADLHPLALVLRPTRHLKGYHHPRRSEINYFLKNCDAKSSELDMLPNQKTLI